MLRKRNRPVGERWCWWGSLLVGIVGMALFGITAVSAETIITVDETRDEINDDDNCSLREAIEVVNGTPIVGCSSSGSGNMVIQLQSQRYTILLDGADEDNNQTGDFDIAASVTIRGNGDTATIINGNSSDRIFDIDPLASGEYEVIIEGVRVENGRPPAASLGGGVKNIDDALTLNGVTIIDNQIPADADLLFGRGAGVYNEIGTLNINNSAIIDNVNNKGLGGGIMSGINTTSGAQLNIFNSVIAENQALQPTGTTSGGGIFIYGNANILNSAIVNNYVQGQSGGIHVSAIFSEPGMVNIANSTIAKNRSTGSGGGIRVFNGSTLYLSYSTVTENVADENGSTFGDGGGIRMNGHMVVKGSIIYNNEDTNDGSSNYFPDVRNTGIITSTGFNVTGTITGTTNLLHGVNGDVVGADPALVSLATTDNYYPLDMFSLSLNKIFAPDCTFISGPNNSLFVDGASNETDQLGNVRPDNVTGECDSGAFEASYLYTYLPVGLGSGE